MELALSLGDTPKTTTPSCPDQSRSHEQIKKVKELGFCMNITGNSSKILQDHDDHQYKNSSEKNKDDDDDDIIKTNVCCSISSWSDHQPPPLHELDLLPFSPALHQSPPPRPFPWLSQIFISSSDPESRSKHGKGLDVKPLTVVYDDHLDNIFINNGTITADHQEAAATIQSSPTDTSNSDTSSFHMDFSSFFKSSSSTRLPLLTNSSRDLELATGNNYMQLDYFVGINSEKDQRLLLSSRRCAAGGGNVGSTSDEDENGLLGRKKLRLTKQQSAFLEESFKQHNTLNPKQKLILANQLNLRPRQVEVWFQNRRARTKLKQTEVDCEYLKTCCETLTEENRRLQKELQELRALKITTSSHPFYMQLPPTTLTMCPSCERVVTTTTAAATTVAQQPTSASCPSHE